LSATLGANENDLRELRQDFRGPLLWPGEVEYDKAKYVWNDMYNDRAPALIVQPVSPADVVAAVKFARARTWTPAIKGGGHNVTGYSTCDGELLIDMGLMRSVSIDPDRRTAVVGGGATQSDFDRTAQLYGLATPGGAVSHTGVGGLTLGGGYGHLTRQFGFAVDNVLGVEIVTADGEFRVADADHNPDLFWAVRGGGGNFGVVTSIRYRLHEVGPDIWTAMGIWPAERARDVWRFFRDWGRDQPEQLAFTSVALHSPEQLLPTIPLPDDIVGRRVIWLIANWFGPVSQGEAITRDLVTFSDPAFAFAGPNTYVALQAAVDTAYVGDFGMRRYFKTGQMTEFPDPAIDVLHDAAQTLPDVASHIEVNFIGGAANRIDPTSTPLGQRRARYNSFVANGWTDEAADVVNMRWAQDAFAGLEPHLDAGIYINYLDRNEESRISKAYGEENWKRLRVVKRRYDPDNLFCRNQNIPPSGE
jgi:FAD/FMN-containing dehydrogenase